MATFWTVSDPRLSRQMTTIYFSYRVNEGGIFLESAWPVCWGYVQRVCIGYIYRAETRRVPVTIYHYISRCWKYLCIIFCLLFHFLLDGVLSIFIRCNLVWSGMCFSSKNDILGCIDTMAVSLLKLMCCWGRFECVVGGGLNVLLGEVWMCCWGRFECVVGGGLNVLLGEVWMCLGEVWMCCWGRFECVVGEVWMCCWGRFECVWGRGEFECVVCTLYPEDGTPQ